ncbi:PREDICTED: serine/arginine repetitive matrix protein 5-like [Nicrophorus vespilloides]|uniref:Serine/arginine repetitive matrix protein 5-like n=1 Tax=Nicrophorus vespilloides TaxID=110193 RepID=A0ABM1MKB5_NICVS|nr:PREDICTED: serine/arginine repetitive matrix protein 5-like [Nicrophorus vespilloides]
MSYSKVTVESSSKSGKSAISHKSGVSFGDALTMYDICYDGKTSKSTEVKSLLKKKVPTKPKSASSSAKENKNSTDPKSNKDKENEDKSRKSRISKRFVELFGDDLSDVDKPEKKDNISELGSKQSRNPSKENEVKSRKSRISKRFVDLFGDDLSDIAKPEKKDNRSDRDSIIKLGSKQPINPSKENEDKSRKSIISKRFVDLFGDDLSDVDKPEEKENRSDKDCISKLESRQSRNPSKENEAKSKKRTHESETSPLEPSCKKRIGQGLIDIDINVMFAQTAVKISSKVDKKLDMRRSKEKSSRSGRDRHEKHRSKGVIY